MKLADRVRRALGSDAGPVRANGAEGSARVAETEGRPDHRIYELRRAIGRIESRWAGEVSAAVTRPVLRARAAGPAWVRTSAVPMLHERGCAREERFGDTRLEPPGSEALAELLRVAVGTGVMRPEPHELLFLDTETTGLSRDAGTLPFLIGVGSFRPEDRSFAVQQFLVRDPAEEAVVLEALEQRLAAAKVLVTFNGRSFDLPLLRNRGVLARMRLSLGLPHVDLLLLARRLFRGRLPSLRLGELERSVLGFHREGDVEGALVPSIYLDFLRSGRWDQMARVLEHNQLDVMALAPLLGLVARHVADPLEWAEDAEELHALGVLHLERGDPELGEKSLVRALELARASGTRREVLVSLARRLRRTGRRAEAATLWEEYRRHFPQHPLGWIELAKHHEHVTRDLARALALAEGAPGDHDDGSRVARLRRRLGRGAADGA